jgi:acetyl-CoA acetyltransferase
MREVAVIGVGFHDWGKFPDKTFVDLCAVAIKEALKSANIKWSQIPCLVAGLTGLAPGTQKFNVGPAIAGRLGETGIPIVNVFNMCATATGAFRVAHHIVASGEQDICMVVGTDISPKGFFGFVADPYEKDTDYLRYKVLGLTNPCYWAMECRKRMELYGTTERHLAKVKVACSKHGSLNPRALYKKVYTEEEVLASAMVCDPLRLYEICATRDGAAAAILCSAEKARQYTSKPVTVAGVGMGSSLYGDSTLRLGFLSAPVGDGTVPLLSESYQSAQMAYKMAGIGPEDIDMVELPDNSSWHYLQYLETLGFCGPGEADKLLDDGQTLIGGRLPVCPSGGIASFGEAVAAQGLLQIIELVIQLRGEAGQRQVKNAKVGMAQTYGQMGNSASAILKV